MDLVSLSHTHTHTIQMADKHMKRSPVTRKMRITSTAGSCFPSTRLAKIKRCTSIDEDGDKITASHAAGRKKHTTVQLLWEMVWKFLKRLDTKLPHDPATPRLGLQLGEMHTHVHTQLYLNVSSSINPNSQKKETTQMSINQ